MIDLKSATVVNLDNPIFEEVEKCDFNKRVSFEDVLLTYEEWKADEDVFHLDTVMIKQILYLSDEDYKFINDNYMEEYSFTENIESGSFEAGHGDYMSIYCKVINKETQDYFYFNNSGYLHLRYVAFKRGTFENIK